MPILNIFYDLGMYLSNSVYTHPLCYLVENDNYDLDLYEKVYQFTQRNPSTIFEFSEDALKKILPNMELLKFFYERKILKSQLREVLTYCSFEGMKYILDNYGIFNPRDFQRPFTFGTPNMKPELVEYVIKTYKVDLKGENGFHIMRFAFNQGYIDLITYLLDQGVMLQTKDRIMKSKATTMMNDKEEEEEEYKVRLSVNVFENVMDEVTHTNIEAYKLILENGGRANAKGQGVRNSLLDYHSMKGNFEVVKILVEHGACISKNTLFQCRDYRILCFLIDHAKQKILEKKS